MSDMKVKVFLSYSHRDSAYKEQLCKHLIQLKRNEIIETWTDNLIKPGQLWEEEISKQMENANVFILLISVDFLNSYYCFEKELNVALQKHHDHKAIVIPILIKPCDWENSMISKLQALPGNGRYISRVRDKNQVYLDIVHAIQHLIEDFSQEDKKAKPPKHKPAKRQTKRQYGLKLSLPINSPVIVKEDFLNSFNDYVSNIYNFSSRAQKIIVESSAEQKRYRETLPKNQYADWDSMGLELFLQQIAREINHIFFRFADTRVHFRYLDFRKKKYLKLVAIHSQNIYSEELKPMPWNSGLIFHTQQQKRSLIRSLNPDINHCGNNDNRYKDHITFTFSSEKLIHNGHSIISMGISFENPDQYGHTIYLLNHCRFENQVESVIVDFANESGIDIVGTILYNQSYNQTRGESHANTSSVNG